MRFCPRFLRRRQERSEAAGAREKAERDLAVTRAQTPAIRDLADALRELRQRNHIAESFQSAFRRGQS